MDKKQKYDERVVVDQLQKKQDIRIDLQHKTIKELTREKGKGDVGIGSKGKIDYLTKYCGFIHMFVPEF